MARDYARLGRFDEARAVVKQVLDLTPDFTVSKWLSLTVMRGADREYVTESMRLAGFPAVVVLSPIQ